MIILFISYIIISVVIGCVATNIYTFPNNQPLNINSIDGDTADLILLFAIIWPIMLTTIIPIYIIGIGIGLIYIIVGKFITYIMKD